MSKVTENDDLIERCAKAASDKAREADARGLAPRSRWHAIARAVLTEAIQPGSCVVRVDDLRAALSAADYDHSHGYTDMVERRLYAACEEGGDNGK